MATQAKPDKLFSFHRSLILKRWMLSHFLGGDMPSLQKRLNCEHIGQLEYQDGQTPFYHELARGVMTSQVISKQDLVTYDRNIFEIWANLMKKRETATSERLQMKYFQYLPLLFSEIYLDWYFHKREQLLLALNEELASNQLEEGHLSLESYRDDDLSKLAFWSATGSGKTFVMHANLLQYQSYCRASKECPPPDRIILLTPNEGLSRQHLKELALSGIPARKLDRAKDLLQENAINITEITKLADTDGDKTIAAKSLEGRNLVFVDEGHRGTTRAEGEWMERRSIITKGGFVFEYSATFSQSVAKGRTVEEARKEIVEQKAKRRFGKRRKYLNEEEKEEIQFSFLDEARARTMGVRETYAKSIIFDYSYKYFYSDGYGKEPVILNLSDKGYRESGDLYFTACLLSFYQQIHLWERHQIKIREFKIEKPLWIFVGNTVAGEGSDVIEILRRITQFLSDRKAAVKYIDDLINNTARLLDNKRQNIFQGRFAPLSGLKASEVYQDIILQVFNSRSRQELKVISLRKTGGEFALCLGNEKPFGLISVGDGPGFYKNAKSIEGLSVTDDIFSTSIFETINNRDSMITVLIGAKKFVEGWSSWRVSTMGLLNMGRGEGSQIIQLFGRGVRLKGQGLSLKRTPAEKCPEGTHMHLLETLNIFGVKANYMAAFKDYLQDSDFLPDNVIELDFKTRRNHFDNSKLKTLRLRKGYGEHEEKGFRNAVFPVMGVMPDHLDSKIRKPHAQLDLYPLLGELHVSSSGKGGGKDNRYKGKISRQALACFDWDAIYFAVQRHKMERNYCNLQVDSNRLLKFCREDDSWYTLYMPAKEFEIHGYDDIKRQEEVFIRLITIYTSRFYNALKNAYEGQFFETTTVSGDSANIIDRYTFEISDKKEGLECIARLKHLQSLVAGGEIGKVSEWNDPHIVAISFSRHLYYPLLAIGDDAPLRMRPLAFDAESEVKFVTALEEFYDSPVGREKIKGKSLYLLRNSDSKNKGIGFAMAGNFYPDFLLWLVEEETGMQWLTFIDPKGILKVDLSDPKFTLYKEIKQVEQNIGDPKLVLNAFVLSISNFKDLFNVSDDKQALENRHILFMEDGGDVYLTKLLEKVLAEEQVS